jgi:triphosphatase
MLPVLEQSTPRGAQCSCCASRRWVALCVSGPLRVTLTSTKEAKSNRCAASCRATGMKELAETLASRRAAAFNRAKAAVDSPRYRSLLLDTLQWLENGYWPELRGRQGGPIERFAAKVLARRTRKAKKKAGKVRKLDPRQRHTLRIAVKKLRYGSDFFENLFVGRRAGKRLSRFKIRLKELQDCLGALNDISVHQKLASKLATRRAPAKNRATGLPRRSQRYFRPPEAGVQACD